MVENPRSKRRWRRFGMACLSVTGVIVTGTLSGWYYLQHRPQPPAAEERLFEGVSYRRIVRKKPRPVIIHIVTVDLTTPGLRFLVTPGERHRELPLIARTTSGFLQEVGAQLAINGDFFYPWHSTTPWDYYPHVGDPVTANGRACSNGVCYALGEQRDKLPSLFIAPDNRVHIGRTAPNRNWMYNVISGSPILMEEGAVKRFTGLDKHPRTAVAITRNSKKMLLFIVDGRQPRYSEGLTMAELAELIKEQGGWNALNLDGGGSSTLAISPEPHRTRVLNSTIDNHIPGRERPVANHLAIFAPPLSP